MAATPTVISKTREQVYIPPEYRTRRVTRCYDPPPPPPDPSNPQPPPPPPDVPEAVEWICTIYFASNKNDDGRLWRVKYCYHPTLPYSSESWLGPA